MNDHGGKGKIITVAVHFSCNLHFLYGEQWLSGGVLDSRQRGCWFEPHWVVLEQDTFILARYWFNPGRPVPV